MTYFPIPPGFVFPPAVISVRNHFLTLVSSLELIPICCLRLRVWCSEILPVLREQKALLFSWKPAKVSHKTLIQGRVMPQFRAGSLVSRQHVQFVPVEWAQAPVPLARMQERLCIRALQSFALSRYAGKPVLHFWASCRRLLSSWKALLLIPALNKT